MTNETLSKAKTLLKKLDIVIAKANQKIKSHSSKAQKFLEQKQAVHTQHTKIKSFIGKVEHKHVKKIHLHSHKLSDAEQHLHKHHASYKGLTEKYKEHLAVFKSVRERLIKQMKNISAGKYSEAKKNQIDAWLDAAIAKVSAISD
jgi:uncharacterized protein (DUF3084 family)